MKIINRMGFDGYFVNEYKTVKGEKLRKFVYKSNNNRSKPE